MNIDDFNNKIVILEDNVKESFLNKINKLINIKIITLSELKKNYCFDYTTETIYFITKKYNFIPKVAKKYIENIYFVDNIDNKKVNFLLKIKRDLEDNNLLIKNELFKEFLKEKDIILYELDYVDNFYNKIFDEIKKYSNVTKYNIKKDESIKKIYAAKNMEGEITFVATKICELIKSGVNINDIKISNVSNDYYFTINKIFKLFNLEIELPSFENIKGTIVLKEFKKRFNNNIEELINYLKEKYNSEEETKIINKIVKVINKYAWSKNYDDVKKLIFDEIDLIKKDNIKKNNTVRVVEFNKSIIKDTDYVFLINFTEGVLPVNHKDEDYLSDDIKEKLNVSTSYDLNEKEILKTQENIKKIKNLIITYPKYSLSGEIYISSAYEKELFIEKRAEINFSNSNKYNKLKLVSEKDEFTKYGTTTDNLLTLNQMYKNELYLSYNNTFKNINKNELYKYINSKLTLSYTSMNTYNKCGFRYYLDYILKINKYKDSFEATVGTLFHKILSKCFYDEFDFELEWYNELKNIKYEFTESEKYFINKLKGELLSIINIIKNQLNYTSLKKTMYEKEITVNVNEELNIKFVGYVDKILYDEYNNQKVVAIVDYKTGNANLNLNNIPYGIEMQLPIYIYLIKNEIKDVRIGGFYLQKILSNITNKEKREESLKLQGYTNRDENITSLVDSSYNNSKIIKSLKTSSNGFYAYSKVLTDEEIDKIYELVKDKINETSKNILNGCFDINPKEISGKNIGCEFCKYRDICYMTPRDTVKLKEIKNVLGGEDYDNMD